MEFYNREKEIRDLLNMIRQEPNLITFIYGPINSGKTSLMLEVMKRLPKEYVAFYIDLRGYAVTRRDEFLKVLFETYDEETFRKKVYNILRGVENFHKAIPILKHIWKEFFKIEEVSDAFKHVENFLQELYDKGLKPIIIFDELQVIKDIKINNFLIYRLFNFFVRLSKVLHICHVFAITSDSTFIERIYDEAMLQGRSRYYLVDDFDRETVEKILRSKGFSNEEIDTIWHYFGGKPIYLVEAIQAKRISKDVRELCEKFYRLRRNQVLDMLYILRRENAEMFRRVIEVLKKFLDRDEVIYEEISPEILWLINKNILFLEPVNRIIKPQSHLELLAIRDIIQIMNKHF